LKVLAENAAQVTAADKNSARPRACYQRRLFAPVQNRRGKAQLRAFPAKARIACCAVNAAGTGTEAAILVKINIEHTNFQISKKTIFFF
jgi:hypothetical protein